MGRYRELKKDVQYHVKARVNRQEFIFKDKSIKELLLQVIEKAKEKYEFKIINFCIMGNHLHMIIQPLADECLSNIMQWILSIFARRFNKLKGYVGHVWIARFISKIIDDIRNLLSTFRHITEHPIRDGLVKNPLDYELNGICFLKHNIYTILAKPEGEVARLVKTY